MLGVAIACDAAPAGDAQPVVVATAPEADDDTTRREACLALRQEHRSGACATIGAAQRALACLTAPADDPACTAIASDASACREGIDAYARVHEPARVGEDVGAPASWTCEPPRAKPGGRAEPRPPLGADALVAGTCARIYAGLRGFPNVDRAVLEHAWRSDACRRRVRLVYDALSPASRETWASRWIEASSTDAVPWRIPQALEAPARERLFAAVNGWCATSPCTVLGRCVARTLDADHPTSPGALVCVATSDDACRGSAACKAEGRCTLDAKRSMCVAGSAADCAASTLCGERGLCARVDAPAHIPGYGASCGGTTPATSGADLLGFIDNPALGVRAPLLAIDTESVTGPHSAAVVGLTNGQRDDVVDCLAPALAVAPGAQISLHLRATLEAAAPTRVDAKILGAVGNMIDAAPFAACVERRASAWKVGHAVGSSTLVVDATLRAK